MPKGEQDWHGDLHRSLRFRLREMKRQPRNEASRAKGGGLLDREVQSAVMFALQWIAERLEMVLEELIWSALGTRHGNKRKKCKPSALPRGGLGASNSPPPMERLRPAMPPFVPEKPLRPSVTSTWEPLEVWWNRPEPGMGVAAPAPVLGVDANAKDLGFRRGRWLDGVPGTAGQRWLAGCLRGKIGEGRTLRESRRLIPFHQSGRAWLSLCVCGTGWKVVGRSSWSTDRHNGTG